MTRVVIECESPRDLLKWCVAYCENQGYSVDKAYEWEPTGEFCKRMGIASRAFWRLRHRKGCPPIEMETGPTGRTIRIKATPALERFCTMHRNSLKDNRRKQREE